jgi:holin-like protein
MLIVLALLSSRRMNLFSMAPTGSWQTCFLFLVPVVLAALDHREFLGLLGLKVLAVILIGTLAVMIVTAFM